MCYVRYFAPDAGRLGWTPYAYPKSVSLKNQKDQYDSLAFVNVLNDMLWQMHEQYEKSDLRGFLQRNKGYVNPARLSSISIQEWKYKRRKQRDKQG